MTTASCGELLRQVNGLSAARLSSRSASGRVDRALRFKVSVLAVVRFTVREVGHATSARRVITQPAVQYTIVKQEA